MSLTQKERVLLELGRYLLYLEMLALDRTDGVAFDQELSRQIDVIIVALEALS